MKKIFTSALMILATVSLFSQGIYLRAGSGYGLPASTFQIGERNLRTEVYNNSVTTNDYSTDVVSASYGAGANFTFAVGYKFNQNFILDFDVYYLAGKKYETSDIHTYTSDSFSGTDSEVFTTSSRGLYFNPSVVFSAGFGKRAPYGRFGLIAASPKIIEDESYNYNLDGTSTYDARWEYRKGLALGFQAAIGMNWKLSEMIDIYTEADFISMNYYAKEGLMTKSISNGTDNLSQLGVYSKEILFKKKYNPQTPYDGTKPQLAPRMASPFSSLSIQAGIRFTIWQVSK
jgi:hypothetical protein